MYTENQELYTKRYGARRPVDDQNLPIDPSPDLERVWDAAGMWAGVGTNTSDPLNPFDDLFPWCMMRVCNIQVENGRATVTAYEGDAAFTRDGSNGSVAVEIPLFYTAPRFPGDGYEYWGVSGTQHPGWQINPAFLSSDGSVRRHTYVAAYEISEKDGLLTSRSGALPKVGLTIGECRTAARHTGAELYDLCHHSLLEDLIITEFATLFTHGVMTGSCDMPYSNLDEDCIQNSEDGNRVVVSPAYAAQFVAGQTVGIGLKRGRNQITSGRTLTKVCPESGELFLDGTPLPIRAGQFIYTQGWKCGSTDTVLSPSGSPVSNHLQKYCCRYRGIENLWGNLYKWVDGCWAEDHRVYVSSDPAKYGNDFKDSYTQLGYLLADENGFPTALGSDPAALWARLPIAVGGSRETYCTDFYYQGDGIVTLRTGGHWGTPRSSGFLSFAPTSPAEYCGTAITGRLIWPG